MNTPSSNDPADIMDRAWALKQIGGDEGLFGDIARVFLIDSPALRHQLEVDLAGGRLHAVQQTAHCIKSAVGNFGAKRAMAAAQALESAAKAGEQDSVPAQTETLLLELRAVEDALRPFAS